MTIFEQLRAIASDIFGVSADRIITESSPENIETWDSIQQLNLVLTVEETFSLQLSPEEVEQIRSIGDFANLVESKLQSDRTP